MMPCMFHIFFGFVINTTAYHLDRYSLHFLPLKSQPNVPHTMGKLSSPLPLRLCLLLFNATKKTVWSKKWRLISLRHCCSWRRLRRYSSRRCRSSRPACCSRRRERLCSRCRRCFGCRTCVSSSVTSQLIKAWPFLQSD